MPLYELTKERIVPIAQTTFAKAGYLERDDLQRLFKDQIEVLVPDAYVLKEEFCEWDGSKCRIDLLLVDSDANIVVLELKRIQDGGAMELQALRYRRPPNARFASPRNVSAIVPPSEQADRHACRRGYPHGVTHQRSKTGDANRIRN